MGKIFKQLGIELSHTPPIVVRHLKVNDGIHDFLLHIKLCVVCLYARRPQNACITGRPVSFALRCKVTVHILGQLHPLVKPLTSAGHRPQAGAGPLDGRSYLFECRMEANRSGGTIQETTLQLDQHESLLRRFVFCSDDH